MSPPGDRFHDEAAGPVVRPFVLTGGRLEPEYGYFDFATLILATVENDDIGEETRRELGPEHLAIMRVCRRPLSVVEIAQQAGDASGRADAGERPHLPVATVRVLLGDLLGRGLIERETPQSQMAEIELYEEVIRGLRAL